MANTGVADDDQEDEGGTQCYAYALMRGERQVVVSETVQFDGDRVEIRSHIGATYGKAVLAHGIRPDTLVIPGQFDHWATPVAKDFGMPSLNTVAPMSLELTDATGSGADIVRVAIRRLEGSTVQ